MDKNGNITDEDIDKLLDEHTITAKSNEAHKKRKGLSKPEFHRLRALCKRNLFFLCYSILGNTRLSTNLHGALCKQVDETHHDKRRFREYLLARGNFKSTIITIGDTLRISLPYTEEDAKYDDDKSEMPWPMSLGPDCRSLIAHETHESAARFLYAIANHVLNNVKLITLFPEIVPSPRKHRINKWELEFPRSITGNPEPTIDTLGVGGKSQGRHYNFIKLDDIFGDKARDSQAESDTTKEWFDNIQAFFSTFAKDRFDLIGTRYSYDDIYAHAEERYGDQLIVYRRKIEERNPATGKLEITFPEEFTPESLAILKQNKKIYSAQYLNDPDEDGAGFDAEWRKTFIWKSPILLQTIEPEGVQSKYVNVRDLDVCILIDPGEISGGFVVTGMDHLSTIYSLVAIRLDLKPPDLVDLIFKQVIRWQPRLVAIESDIFANTYQYWLVSEMSKRGVHFKVHPVYTKKRAKNERIAGLTNYMSAGQFYYNEAQTDLHREIKTWGKSKNIHILDALAYGPEVWRPGYAPGTRYDNAIVVTTGLREQDVETGYSIVNDEPY